MRLVASGAKHIRIAAAAAANSPAMDAKRHTLHACRCGLFGSQNLYDKGVFPAYRAAPQSAQVFVKTDLFYWG
jgi:hypothetical protein